MNNVIKILFVVCTFFAIEISANIDVELVGGTRGVLLSLESDEGDIFVTDSSDSSKIVLSISGSNLKIIEDELSLSSDISMGNLKISNGSGGTIRLCIDNPLINGNDIRVKNGGKRVLILL